VGLGRPALHERINQAVDHAFRQQRYLNKLEELKSLIMEHPQVARMIELIDELNLH
jgi:hypothetical protein